MKRSKLRSAILITLVVLCVIAWSVLLLNIFVFGQGHRDDTVDNPLPTDSLPPIELPLLTDSPPQAETPSPSASPDVIIGSPTPDAEETPAPIPPPEIINIIENDKELSEILDRTAANFNCVAASLAVYDGDNTFSVYQYGYANKSDQRLIDINTKFRVASLSKIITTICALILSGGSFLVFLKKDLRLFENVVFNYARHAAGYLQTIVIVNSEILFVRQYAPYGVFVVRITPDRPNANTVEMAYYIHRLTSSQTDTVLSLCRAI